MREKEGIFAFERISAGKGVYQKFVTALGQTSEVGNVWFTLNDQTADEEQLSSVVSIFSSVVC